MRLKLYVGICLLLISPALSWANESQILLDAELDHWLTNLTEPLLKASDMPPKSVNFHIILNEEVNAFATAGNHIFINTGLISRAESVNEVRGVLAHELGHIRANHLFERYDDIASARWATLAGALVGLGAAVAGSPDGVMAGLLGSQAYGVSNLLKHSRTQEREADSYATQTLHDSGYSTKGMVSFFQKLRNDSLLTYTTPPAHLLTHPLPAERMDSLQHQTATEENNLQDVDVEEDHAFTRIQAKVYAFSHSPSQTLRRYRDESSAAKLAQAMAYLYQGKFAQADERLEALLNANPQDPFLHELAGHIALDRGNLAQAEQAFSTALQQEQDLPLVRFHYARALLAQNKNTAAIDQLRSVQHALPTWPSVWYLLGSTLGKLDFMAESHLALAEYYLLTGQQEAVRQQILLAEPYLKNAPEALIKQKNDIETALEEAKK